MIRPHATAPTSATGPVPVATFTLMEVQPRVVVTPRTAYVVVGVQPDRIGTRSALTIAYVAATDPATATAPGTAERTRSAAEDVFRALQVVTEMSGTEEFSVIALFGAPGEPGIAQQVTFTHGPEAWRASAVPLLGNVAAMPALAIAVERDDVGERAAIDLALRFVEHLDRLEFDAAWDLSSAEFRATTSRGSFEAQSRSVHRPSGDGQRLEKFHSFAPGPFVPGAELDVLFARPPMYDAVMLRMADDRTWRVAGLLTIGPDEPSGRDAIGVTAAL